MKGKKGVSGIPGAPGQKGLRGDPVSVCLFAFVLFCFVVLQHHNILYFIWVFKSVS